MEQSKAIISRPTLVSKFKAHVRKTPQVEALVYKDSTWSYNELDQFSDLVAGRIIASGVTPGQVVGIIMDRTPEMIVGILGILKARAAYLPIDPNYPNQRILNILSQSSPGVILINNDSKHRVQLESVEKKTTILGLELSELLSTVRTEFITGRNNSLPIVQPEDLAYVIFTSGSTGNPKGVMIEHKSVLQTLNALQFHYPMRTESAFLFKTSFSFDASVPEIFSPLIGGGRIVIMENGKEKDPSRISEYIYHYKVSHMNMVPSMNTIMLEWLEESEVEAMSSLQYVFSVGEALPHHTALTFAETFPKVQFVNLYGPTEASVYSTHYSLAQYKGKTSKIPIGKPFSNVEILLLDEKDNVVEHGESGELCIAGEGLARGYFNCNDLTEKSFVFLSSKSHLRIYRTGDLAKWNEEGHLEYLGRLDHQVKIRGYRIEVEEIEMKLINHSSIKEAAVVAKLDEENIGYLVGYIVCEGKIDLLELKRYLSDILPDFMIPSDFFILEQIPRNINGKLDRNALIRL
ncbi:amino acid adenylation domain-containing protein [Paenibacillus sp. JGP012]|uniref:amino acid adenylation domain-containing protein n=1 Tax=Paenibacillus sp. JGP012 TaxID=2735914 RepID=UPI0016202A70|nr:amino acid adenylation domain-containing protein [Paenibacillus sp. JGP012]MBB6022769.1 amino acid adenylation domain-containing protein [Paenibacillus sp. JGP012]